MVHGKNGIPGTALTSRASHGKKFPWNLVQLLVPSLPMGPLVNLYRLVEATWDVVDRVDPEATVAWDRDMPDRPVERIEVAGPVPCVRSQLQWYCWIDGSWRPWNIKTAWSFLSLYCDGWGEVTDHWDLTTKERGAGDFVVLPSGWSGRSPDGVPPWRVNVRSTPGGMGPVSMSVSDADRSWPFRTLDPSTVSQLRNFARTGHRNG